MLLVLTLPHHPYIMDWDDARTWWSTGTMICVAARLWSSTPFRRRMRRVGAAFTSLCLLWPVWLMLHELGTTWRLCDYGCCTILVLLAMVLKQKAWEWIKECWHWLAILLLCNPATSVACCPTLQALPIAFTIALCLCTCLTLLILSTLAAMYHGSETRSNQTQHTSAQPNTEPINTPRTPKSEPKIKTQKDPIATYGQPQSCTWQPLQQCYGTRHYGEQR